MIFDSKQFDKTVIILAAFVYLICAYLSVGYIHADEHFQIWEFANFKLGNTSESSLPWEYHDKIRSTLQPWLAYIVLFFLSKINCNDPYLITLFCRLCTSIFALIVIYRFVNRFKHFVGEKYHGVLILVSYFLWFLPLVNCRFSSETLSGIFFLWALSFLNLKSKDFQSTFVVGVLCGFAFLFRYQVAFMITGLFLWLIYIKIDIKYLILFILGCALVVGFGVLIDRLFYQVWVLTSWEYFYTNIIQDVASSFGTTSWYSFMAAMVTNMFLPIGLVVILAVILYFAINPRSIFTWILLPFIVVHLLIPHKEIRFLFPIVNFLPLVIVSSIEMVISLAKKSSSDIQIILSRSLLCIGALNVITLIPGIVVIPSNGRIAMTKYVSSRYLNDNVSLYYLSTMESNPFQPYDFLHQSFYLKGNFTFIPLTSIDTLSKDIFENTGDVTRLFVLRNNDLLNPEIRNKIAAIGLKPEYYSNPRWTIPLRKMLLGDPFNRDYILYKFE